MRIQRFPKRVAKNLWSPLLESALTGCSRREWNFVKGLVDERQKKQGKSKHQKNKKGAKNGGKEKEKSKRK